MSKEMSPNWLAYLDEERQFQEAHQKGKVRRVKFDKVNEAWLCRFLPVGLGPRELWYVRLGQHWVNKLPIVCPQCVSPDFGGDPQAACPVCELANSLNAEDDDATSSFGFRLKTNITYLTYCLVYEIDPGRGENTVMSEVEIFKPWEFQHYKTSFDELINYFRRGVSAKRPLSVLDLDRGNDFWAVKTAKGVRLDRQEPAPIFDLDDPAREQKLDQIWAAITQPRIKIPTLKELETFARKAEAAAYGEDDRFTRRPGRYDETDEEDRHRAGRSSRRMANAQAEEAAEQDQETAPQEDQIPGAEVPPRSVAPAAAARPVGRPPTAAAAAPRPVGRPPAAARPAASAAVGAPASVRSATATRPAAAAAGTAAPAAAARPVGRPVGRPPWRSAAAVAAASSVNEEEDAGVAEEATDVVAPAEEPLPEEQAADEAPETGAEGGEPAEGNEEAPPAPAGRAARAAAAAAAAPVNAGLRARLLNRVKGAA